MNLHQINTSIAVNCVLLGFNQEDVFILLTNGQSSLSPSKTESQLDSLPQADLHESESLMDCAERLISALIGAQPSNCKQFATFGGSSRFHSSNQRLVSVGYYSFIPLDSFGSGTMSGQENTHWIALRSVEALAHDHHTILMAAIASIRLAMQHKPTVFELLPPRFTLGQVQKLFETLLDQDLDKRNFRRKILSLGILEELSDKQIGVAHKPARYYSIDPIAYNKIVTEPINYS